MNNKRQELQEKRQELQEKRQKYTAIGKYLNRWLIWLAAILIFGGMFSFGILMTLGNAFSGDTEHVVSIDPVWMIGMIPFMLLITVPITIVIAKSMYKHFETLTTAMNDVANGKIDVYIPVANADAFSGIYEDFNKMAAEISGIQTLRTALVDGFSHELKTPVASINGFAKMLLEEDLTEETRKKYLQIIVKESDRLASLSKNNSLLNKIDAQEIVTDKTKYNLGHQIQDIAIALENVWGAKNINLSAELIDAEFFGNAGLMESLWQNLLTNAIKFTPRGGDITITMSETADEITVSVADTGIGMSADVKEKIFERYYQGDTSHSGEGHGLGLSIAKRVVRLADGDISVESREGEGSTFTVVLPKN